MKRTMTIATRALALSALLMAPRAWAGTVQVTANLTASQTWSAGNEYVLNGKIYVLSPAVLTIEPGAVIKGKSGTAGDPNTISALLIAQGAKIIAEGTRTQPIIFTSDQDDVTLPDDLPIYARGLWGGLVLLGNTVLNTSIDVAGNAANPKYDVFEALPDLQINGQYVHRYGGNNDEDNSGVLRYVSIRHAGFKVSANKELNGLTLCCVGRGTTIDHVEMYAAADDGVEFFGGTVNTKYMVSAFNDDDAFDIDQGYRGQNQFWFAIQEPGTKDNGGEWNGEPTSVILSNTPLANFEVYNATWIGAGPGTTGNRGLLVRDYAAPRVHNSILTEFGGNGISVDSDSGWFLGNGLIQIDNNIWWNFALAVAETANAQTYLFDDASKSNLLVNPMLMSISRGITPPYQLDPRLQAGSPALSTPLTPPMNGFYSPVTYKGAFGTDDLWLRGWTALDAYGFLPLRGSQTIQVTANITTSQTWSAANEYVLNGKIYVLSPAVLTIEPGTVIKGKSGTAGDPNTISALLIAQGAKIIAEGTPDNPIIFTSDQDDVTLPDDLPIYARGLWGGLVLLGNTVLNTSIDVAGNAANPKYDVFEALPDLQINGQYVHRYGGNNDDDNSGVLRYVSIRHAGFKVSANKELNGLTLCCVGRGTTIDHVEMYAAADDGVEFFGGTVNTKYMVSAFNDDDAFDIDQGYRGQNQFWFAIQEPGTKDNGGEWNGEPTSVILSNTPLANFEVYNATWIGAGTGTTGNRGLLVRDYAAPKVHNSILTEFGGSGISVDSDSGWFLGNGLIQIDNNIWWNFALAVAETANAQTYLFDDASKSNLLVNPMLMSISRGITPPYQLDPRLQAGSPALSTPLTPPNNGFYSPVTYKGAFKDVNWASGWTALSEYGILAALGGGEPPTSVIPSAPTQPRMTTPVSNGSPQISFVSQVGVTYQLETITNLTLNNWATEGNPIPGTGSAITIPFATTNSAAFFRVRAY